MKIGFLVNDVVPEMGLPCSGQGLRAWGLLKGLQANGVEATVLVRHSMLSSRMRRWSDLNQLRLPDWLKVVDANTINDAIAQFDGIVLHNWAAAEKLIRPKSGNTSFIYDFFSASLVEHSFISSDESHLESIKKRKLHAINQSNIFIANGVGRRDYATKFLAVNGRYEEVSSIPMCLPWLGQEKPKKVILIGGYQQRWTKDFSNDVLVKVAEAFPEFSIVTIGRRHHYHFGATGWDQKQTADLPANLLTYDVMSFQDYSNINAAAAAFVDIAPINEERRISFSSRGVFSVASGCPVIHNAETDLGALLEEFDAGVTLSETEDFFDASVIIKKIRSCLSVDRYAACKALWAAHFQSSHGARTLAELI